MDDLSLASDVESFLVRVAELLHRYGTPSHRLERVMTKVSRSLNCEGAFLYTPTALIVSFRRKGREQVYLRRVDSGAIDAQKLLLFDEILERLEDGRLTVPEASEAMERAASSRPLYGPMPTVLACGLACASVAILFGGTWMEVGLAGILGMGVALLDLLQGRLGWENGLQFPVAGFSVAILSLAFAKFVLPIDDRLVSLASLIVLLPGLTLTIALTEIAVGHLSAGVARLAGAGVILLTLLLGVGLAWKLGGDWRSVPAAGNAVPDSLSGLAFLVAPASFAVLFRLRFSLWWLVYLVCWCGFFVSDWGGQRLGYPSGAFLGALTVGSICNLYARLRDRPAMVPLAPGMIMLVPGSLGYRSLAALIDKQTMEGVDLAFSMLAIAVGLVGGSLASNAIVPPKRIL